MAKPLKRVKGIGELMNERMIEWGRIIRPERW